MAGSPSAPCVRLGIVGLGEAAQLLHLPALANVPDLFAITGLHDGCATLTARLAARFPRAKTFADAAELIGDGDIEAVLVLSPDQYHAEHTIAALTAGKHVLVEKPACLCPTDLEHMVAAERSSPARAMVGYMRCLSPAFEEGLKRLEDVGPLNYVRVRDLQREGPWFYDQVAPPLVARDLPLALADEGRARLERQMATILRAGDPAWLGRAYRVLTGASCHSFAALRVALGRSPVRVVGAGAKRGGENIVALLDYGEFQALYEIVIDDIARFEARMEFLGRDRSLTITHDTPYIRNLPTTLEWRRTTGETHEEGRLGPYYEDPFKRQLQAFHRMITTAAPSPAPLADSGAELGLFAAILNALRAAEAGAGPAP